MPFLVTMTEDAERQYVTLTVRDRRVIEEATPYLSMYPFADAIPERFR